MINRKTDAERISVALTDLKLDQLQVVYPGDKRYMLADKVMVVPLAEFIGVE